MVFDLPDYGSQALVQIYADDGATIAIRADAGDTWGPPIEPISDSADNAPVIDVPSDVADVLARAQADGLL